MKWTRYREKLNFHRQPRNQLNWKISFFFSQISIDFDNHFSLAFPEVSCSVRVFHFTIGFEGEWRNSIEAWRTLIMASQWLRTELGKFMQIQDSILVESRRSFSKDFLLKWKWNLWSKTFTFLRNSISEVLNSKDDAAWFQVQILLHRLCLLMKRLNLLPF